MTMILKFVLPVFAEGSPPHEGHMSQGLLLFAFIVLVAGVLYGGRKWREAIYANALLTKNEKVQNKDAVMILCQSVLLLLAAEYAVMAAAAACFPGKLPALGLAVVWSIGGLTAGGVVGFMFGHPKIEENADPEKKRLRKVLPNTSMDQINDWLTKAIVGVGLVEAQRIIAKGQSMAHRIGQGMEGTTGTGADGVGFALAGAILVTFPILGFVTSYMVTRTFVALALCRADVAASDAANGGAQSEQAMFAINDTEFESLDAAPLQLGDHDAETNTRVKEAVEKIASHPLESLVNWKHIRLWAKAQLMRALMSKDDEAKKFAGEAERAFQRAVELVPNDSETRLGYAVALQIRDAGKREVLTQLESARDTLMAKSPVDLRKNVFKSLMFRYLMLPEPESFQKALDCAKAYFAMPGAIPSGGVWVNVACGYGLAASWLAADASRKLDIKDWHLPGIAGPSENDNASREAAVAWLKKAAVQAAKEAVGRDSKWKERLGQLAGLDPTGPDDRDLECVRDQIGEIVAD